MAFAFLNARDAGRQLVFADEETPCEASSFAESEEPSASPEPPPRSRKKQEEFKRNKTEGEREAAAAVQQLRGLAQAACILEEVSQLCAIEHPVRESLSSPPPFSSAFQTEPRSQSFPDLVLWPLAVRDALPPVLASTASSTSSP